MTRASLALSRAASRAWNRAAARARPVAEMRAELLQATALLTGWALLTRFVDSLVSARIDVWACSLGALLLSLCGWRFLLTLFREGLYKLTRESGER